MTEVDLSVKEAKRVVVAILAEVLPFQPWAPHAPPAAPVAGVAQVPSLVRAPTVKVAEAVLVVAANAGSPQKFGVTVLLD